MVDFIGDPGPPEQLGNEEDGGRDGKEIGLERVEASYLTGECDVRLRRDIRDRPRKVD